MESKQWMMKIEKRVRTMKTKKKVVLLEGVSWLKVASSSLNRILKGKVMIQTEYSARSKGHLVLFAEVGMCLDADRLKELIHNEEFVGFLRTFHIDCGRIEDSHVQVHSHHVAGSWIFDRFSHSDEKMKDILGKAFLLSSHNPFLSCFWYSAHAGSNRRNVDVDDDCGKEDDWIYRNCGLYEKGRVDLVGNCGDIAVDVKTLGQYCTLVEGHNNSHHAAVCNFECCGTTMVVHRSKEDDLVRNSVHH